MATFRRQNSERRDRLEPVDQSSRERRASSASRHRPLSATRPRSKSSPPPSHSERESTLTTAECNSSSSPPQEGSDYSPSAEPHTPTSLMDDFDHEYTRFPESRSRSSSAGSFERFRDVDARTQLEAELDSKWILNLSMHFRDKSDREKFFVTYAETPTRWRRVTVSCDYRNAEPGSLEMDLKELQYQRDKSIQIYESIRDSLPEIQFYNTVTNLKLETSEGRLHVHVTEDTNEIIPYPPKTSVEHILEDDDFRPREIRESELVFDSHISGFVYKVRYCGKDYIKKEIPGPDTVDEFLYEINALHALIGSDSVIQLEAIVVDDQRETVKGLLISFAEQGALVDLLYDHKGEISWEDRIRWAQQAVQGLSEIHEEGYVQGDFTLSNIVVDSENNAKIIDINRRGCPVGWEPPEIAKKIQSNQRISMYIGEKTDLYQLGMTLWALAMDDDEPERHDQPLSTEDFPLCVPRWYCDIVETCLQPRPKHRLSAKDLLKMFPSPSPPLMRPTLHGRSSTARAIDKRYIEPSAAVEREDIERLGFSRPRHTEDDFTSRESTVDPVFTDARSSTYQFYSENSYVGVVRGRRPAPNVAHLDMNHMRHQDSGIDLPEACELEPQIIPISPGFDREYDEVDVGGNPYLVSRQSFDPEELDILEGHPRGRRRSVQHTISRQNTLTRLDPVVTETVESDPVDHDDDPAMSEDDDEEIEGEPDRMEAQGPAFGESSIMSGSTPGNGSSIATLSGPYMTSAPTPPPLDIVTADLASFGGHPSSEEHSRNEPIAVPALNTVNETKEMPVISSLDEPKPISVLNSAPEAMRVLSFEDEHEVMQALGSRDEPKTMPVLSSEDEPEATPALCSEGEPEAMRALSFEDEPEAMQALNSEHEAKVMQALSSEDEPEATSALRSEDEPEAIPTLSSEDGPEATPAIRSEDEPEAMQALISEDEPKAMLALSSEDEPEAIPALRSEDEPEAMPALSFEDEPEAMQALGSEHEPKAVQALSSEDEPETTPALRYEDEPEAVLVLSSEDEPKAMQALSSEDEPEAVQALISGDEPETTPVLRSEDEPEAMLALSTEDEPKAMQTLGSMDEPQATLALESVDEPESIVAISSMDDTHIVNDAPTPDLPQAHDGSTQTCEDQLNDPPPPQTPQSTQPADTTPAEPVPEPTPALSLKDTGHDDETASIVSSLDADDLILTTAMEESVYHDVPTTPIVSAETAAHDPADHSRDTASTYPFNPKDLVEMTEKHDPQTPAGPKSISSE
jgi:serine/threonine protein kinase